MDLFTDIDDKWNFFHAILTEVLDDYMPLIGCFLITPRSQFLGLLNLKTTVREAKSNYLGILLSCGFRVPTQAASLELC